MNTFGSVIDTDDITVSSSGYNSAASASDDVTITDVDVVADSDNEFGDVIHECQIVPSRKRKLRLRVGFTDEDIYRIRQKRADDGRKHGEEYDFKLTPHQRATLDRWHEIYEQELQDDKEAFERRMVRNQQTHGKVG